MNTLGFTGMDSRTHATLQQAFADAIARLQLDLQLAHDETADFVVVDMDSLYGPMSWLQLHNAGRTVIGYTRAERCQTHFRLPRDFDAAVLDALLHELAIPHKVVVSNNADPAPAIILPEPAVAEDNTAAPTSPDTSAHPSPEAGLGAWLLRGQIRGKKRLHHPEAPALVLDIDNGLYHGPLTLKPLLPLFHASLAEGDFLPAEGTPPPNTSEQPLQRLYWLAGLVAGRGRLLPEHNPEGRYRLAKWVQTEREYPRHFRICALMMKGPATLAELAAGSGASMAEVADFLNACLAAGTAEEVLPEPAAAPESTRGGIFSRLLGR